MPQRRGRRSQRSIDPAPRQPTGGSGAASTSYRGNCPAAAVRTSSPVAIRGERHPNRLAGTVMAWTADGPRSPNVWSRRLSPGVNVRQRGDAARNPARGSLRRRRGQPPRHPRCERRPPPFGRRSGDVSHAVGSRPAPGGGDVSADPAAGPARPLGAGLNPPAGGQQPDPRRRRADMDTCRWFGTVVVLPGQAKVTPPPPQAGSGRARIVRAERSPVPLPGLDRSEHRVPERSSRSNCR
jgi:hypothetical protein